MSRPLKSALRTYANRTTPWGPPWWIYVVTIGAANLIRQIVMPDDVSTATQVGTFTGMVIGVGGAVTLLYHGMTRHRRERTTRAGRAETSQDSSHTSVTT